MPKHIPRQVRFDTDGFLDDVKRFAVSQGHVVHVGKHVTDIPNCQTIANESGLSHRTVMDFLSPTSGSTTRSMSPTIYLVSSLAQYADLDINAYCMPQ